MRYLKEISLASIVASLCSTSLAQSIRGQLKTERVSEPISELHRQLEAPDKMRLGATIDPDKNKWVQVYGPAYAGTPLQGWEQLLYELTMPFVAIDDNVYNPADSSTVTHV